MKGEGGGLVFCLVSKLRWGNPDDVFKSVEKHTFCRFCDSQHHESVGYDLNAASHLWACGFVWHWCEESVRGRSSLLVSVWDAKISLDGFDCALLFRKQLGEISVLPAGSDGRVRKTTSATKKEKNFQQLLKIEDEIFRKIMNKCGKTFNLFCDVFNLL